MAPQAGAAPATVAVNTAPSYNGLALTPPMGFNNWAGFQCNSQMNESLFTNTADAMVNLGLDKLGYSYVNIDDCWLQKDRDANGNLQVDTSRFPHGMKWLGDYIHSKGLKFGTYESAGYWTCAGGAGSYGHFQQDADQYASWGVDYLKLDYCGQPLDRYPGKTQSQVAEIVYTEASQALLNTGRPIVFSESAPAYVCCSGPDFEYELSWLHKQGNLWRFGWDIANNWDSVLSNYTQANTPGLAGYAGPGHWNDADMLEIGNGGLTLTEEQSQFTLWAELASPLLLSTDLTKLSPAQLDVVRNKDIIAVNQDKLGAQGTIVQSGTDYDVLAKPLADGDVSVVLFNKADHAQTISTTASTVGLGGGGPVELTDLVTKQSSSSSGAIAANVPSHGTVIYRVHRNVVYPNLAAAFNNTAISSGSDPTKGNFDGDGNSYDALALAMQGAIPGAPVTAGGAWFTWPASAIGTPDNVAGGAPVVKVSGQGTKLAFLGAEAGVTSEPVTVTYTDGSTSTASLGFPNWCCAATNGYGASPAIVTHHRNTPSGPANFGINYGVFYNSIPIDPTKTVATVTLPNSSAIHIFALTVQ
jgi:alpha-galactosidase